MMDSFLTILVVIFSFLFGVATIVKVSFNSKHGTAGLAMLLSGLFGLLIVVLLSIYGIDLIYYILFGTSGAYMCAVIAKSYYQAEQSAAIKNAAKSLADIRKKISDDE